MTLFPAGGGQISALIDEIKPVKDILTPATNRDRLAGTPLHKSLPCRVSAL